MKRMLTSVLAATLLSVICHGASFGDVAQSSWYREYVDVVSEKGIIMGVADGKFDPDGLFTVGQCLAVASRIHASENGKKIADVGGAWYMPYVDYCLGEGIIKDGEFDSFTRNVTREEAASVFYSSCDKQNLTPINDTKGISDLSPDDDEYESVISLYRAGVLSGSDEAGSFLPKSHIKRSEISAIVARLTDKSFRVSKKLPYYGSPRYLMEDYIMYGPDSGIMSAWKLDDKYQLGNITGRESGTVRADFGQKTVLYRPLNPIYDGSFRVEVMATLLMVNGGAYISLDNDKQEHEIGIFAKQNSLVIKSGEYEFDTGILVDKSSSEHVFIFDFSLEEGFGYVVIDGKTFYDVPIDADSISRLSLGFDGSGRGAMTLGYARCVADYRVNENFAANEKSEGIGLYGNWKTSGDITLSQMLSERGEDVYSAKMKSKSEAEISFEKIGGRIAVEVNVLLPEKDAVMRFETGAFDIYSDAGSFYHDNVYLRHVAENVWTNIRLEMDFTKKEVFVRINGKDCGVHELAKGYSFIDSVKITLKSEENQIWFDDVKVYSYYDPDDYPEEPKSVNEGGYNVGVNVCNLWRNGTCGEGYDAVAPFDELYPYVGLADEGLPELADWEIKQMTEHGIDFQHICWYSPRNETTCPIKAISMPQIALNDGFMKSKYGDYMKFCIMWENGNTSVKSVEQFKNYIWPYFKEYYFSDSRYLSIDNKAVLTIWNRDNLAKSFGDVFVAREVLDFMKEDIKTLGYDGLIIWFSGDTSVAGIVSDLGGDATYSYNYGRSGEYADYQIGFMTSNLTGGDIYYIPSVSVGFNAVGRHDERSGMITPEEHRRVCEYIKNDYLTRVDEDAWYRNLVMVSTWNEYTEGTYVAPNNLYGFGYLDNVRNVFTEAEKEHEDIMPSEKVKDRMRNLYPDGFSPIRRLRLEDGMEEFNPEETKVVRAWDFSNTSTRGYFTSGHGLESFGFDTGILHGSSLATDFSFMMMPHLPPMIDIEETETRYLHIRMKSDVISRGEMFFTTDDVPNFIAGASVSWDIIKLDEFVDYYVDLSENPYWDGVLTGMRFDPMATPGNFEVELIELLSVDKKDYTKIFFDGQRMDFDFDPEYDEKLRDYMVTLNPRLGFFTMSHTTYEYDYDKKTFCFEGLSGSVLLTVGKDTAILDGKEEKLGFEFSLRDGLPYVPIKWFMSIFGFKYRESGGGIYFDTYDAETKAYVESMVEGQWEFNRFGDTLGWTCQGCAGNIYDGCYNLAVTNMDTAIKNMNLDIDLSKYSKVTVGISFKTDVANPVLQVFFQTKVMKQMNEKASERIPLGTSDTKGEFIEVTLDFSENDDWKGTLTGLRVDPYHGNGTYSVDYVRLG